jgi:hypothetical protein
MIDRMPEHVPVVAEIIEPVAETPAKTKKKIPREFVAYEEYSYERRERKSETRGEEGARSDAPPGEEEISARISEANARDQGRCIHEDPPDGAGGEIDGGSHERADIALDRLVDPRYMAETTGGGRESLISGKRGHLTNSEEWQNDQELTDAGRNCKFDFGKKMFNL